MLGTPEEIVDKGILEFHFHASRKGDALRDNLLNAAKTAKSTTTASSRRKSPSSSWGQTETGQMSKTVPSSHEPNVLTIDSRPNTSAGK